MAQCSASEFTLFRKVGLGAALAAALGATIYYLQRQLTRGKQSTSPSPSSLSTTPAGLAASASELRLGHIVIPVANPATARGLVQLASALGAGQPQAELTALKIVTAPKGVPFEEARRYALAMRENYQGALAEAASYAQEKGIALRCELQVAREAASGILAFADGLADLDLILLGWRGATSLRRVRRSINQEIVRRARTNVAVLRGREPGPIRRILVPVGWGPHARLGLRLAERLARNVGATVTVFRVLPPAGEVDWEGERMALVKLLAEEAPSLRFGNELRLAREPATVPAILAEAQREPYDLLIIGASDEWWLRNWLFGAIPDQVAEQAPCSVLLVRRYESHVTAM